MSNPSRDPLDADLRDLTMLLPQILRTLRSGIGGVDMPAELRSLFLDTPLGPRHIPALAYVAMDGPLSVSELANALQLRLTAASQIVGELARAGLVERREDENDRRRTIVEVDPSARPEIDRWLESRTRPMRQALTQLRSTERRAFLKALRLLASELAAGETTEHSRTRGAARAP
jgi:DNA-binding MarR family transcriptional regulator